MATNKKKTTTKQRTKRPASSRALKSKLAPARKGVKKPFIHHRHSFKLVHHSHTNYALLTFMLLLVGIFSFGWTALAKGDSLTVNAIVNAPPLPAPATITSPDDGTASPISTVTVSGGCPTNSYVELYRNHHLAGAGICQSDNTWSVQTNLSSGANYLDAQDYNVTNMAGPDSNGITVYYTPPPSTNNGSTSTSPTAPTSTTAATDSSSKAGAADLLLGANVTYKGYMMGELSNWPLTISGGTAPYAVQIDWGDGETDLKSVKEAGQFDLQHTYAQAGDYNNSYSIKVTATDADGHTTLLQLFTIITPIGSGEGSSGLGALGGINNSSGENGGLAAQANNGLYHKFVAIAGPTYLVSLVAVGSFWLGGASHTGAVAGHALLRFHMPKRWRF